jgi:hypothetical protein
LKTPFEADWNMRKFGVIWPSESACLRALTSNLAQKRPVLGPARVAPIFTNETGEKRVVSQFEIGFRRFL